MEWVYLFPVPDRLQNTVSHKNYGFFVKRRGAGAQSTNAKIVNWAKDVDNGAQTGAPRFATYVTGNSRLRLQRNTVRNASHVAAVHYTRSQIDV